MQTAPLHTPHELLASFLAGEVSAEQRLAVEEWRQAAAENEAYFHSLAALWEESEVVKQADLEKIEQAWQQLQEQLPRTQPRPLWNWPLLAAAGMAILILSTLAFWWLNRDRVSDLPLQWESYQAQNQVDSLTLGDGSQVALAYGTELKFNSEFGHQARSAQLLSGKAHFLVAPDGEHPFEVEAGDFLIRDLGTAFQISIEEDLVSLVVTEGSVEVIPSQGEKLIVKADEKVNLGQNWPPKVEPIDPFANAWRDRRFSFTGQSLVEVAEILSQAYAVSIDLDKTSLQACQVYTTFESKELEYVLDVICQTLQLNWERADGQYLISGEGC